MAENAPKTVAGSSSSSLASSSEEDGMLEASGSPATEGAVVVPSSLVLSKLPISVKMSSSLAMASANRHAKRDRLLLVSSDCCLGADRFPFLGMVLMKIEKKRPFNYRYEESGITTPTVVMPETGNRELTSTQTMLEKLIR